MSNRGRTQPYVILVATDHSEASNEALQQAFETALDREPSTIHVLHVLDTGHAVVLAEMSEVPITPEPQLIASATAKLRAHVKDQLELHGARPHPLSVTSHLRFGEAAEEIAHFASEVDADLIVVGTHPRHGVSRWLIGSVAEKVVRTAPCPVLVFRRKEASKRPDVNYPDGSLPLPFPEAEALR